eukprot:CAMPEP_0174269022 /NCGR_PEP_ID=MMETSP0439-20130205/39551_1 /TAXON_ID=0 /ORGANISM="Stereomyxa ramosa, Strain Chinc5" /LENGTH=148 /DNA_ID=CAMNT_0015357553 /DNA_START=384 /DNA_END=826 /DNA_ORIENTATION=+
MINFHGVRGGDEFEMILGGKNKVLVKVVECFHAVPSVGFILSTTTQKLKQEYLGLPGREIGALRKKGVEITKTVEQTHFAFLGDTTVEIFDKYPTLVTDVPTIMVECTLLDPGDEDKATSRGHIHWSQLRGIVLSNPETKFVLIHFSR